MTIRCALLSTALLASATGLWAQEDEFFDDQYLRYEDVVYSPHIRTVLFNVLNVNLSLPVIKLGSTERLVLKFDDMRGDYHDYSFTVIQCDRDWKPTSLPPTEYIEGFLEDNVMSYQFSMNATQPYTHFSLTFPNSNFGLKLSGNYILLVYADFDRDKPVITRRFRAYETLVEIEAEVRVPMIVEQRRTHHQINMLVRHPDYEIRNPMRDVAVHIQQNYRWDNLMAIPRPMFVRGTELQFDNMGGVIFEGSNEYRWFDTRSLRFQQANVRTIWRDKDSTLLTHVFLMDEKARNKRYYTPEPDINGAYHIGFREGNYPDTEADYAMVHFRLVHPIAPLSGGIYLYGGLTDWTIQPKYRMDYNGRDGTYEASHLFKQGYYNYHYVYVEDGQAVADSEPIEGSFFEAGQIYTIYVYHKDIGMRYDRLIGHTIIRSRM